MYRLRWGRIPEDLAQDPDATADLLADELPGDVEEVFARHGVRLFPDSVDDLDIHCTWPDRGIPANTAPWSCTRGLRRSTTPRCCSSRGWEGPRTRGTQPWTPRGVGAGADRAENWEWRWRRWSITSPTSGPWGSPCVWPRPVPSTRSRTGRVPPRAPPPGWRPCTSGSAVRRVDRVAPDGRPGVPSRGAAFAVVDERAQRMEAVGLLPGGAAISLSEWAVTRVASRSPPPSCPESRRRGNRAGPTWASAGS